MDRDNGAVDRLLAAWRAEIDSVPLPELVSTEQALAILATRGCPGRPDRGRRSAWMRSRLRCRPPAFLTRRRPTRDPR